MCSFLNVTLRISSKIHLQNTFFLLNELLHRKKPLYLSPLSITWATQKMSYAATKSNGTAKTRSMGILDFSQRKDKVRLNLSLADGDCGSCSPTCTGSTLCKKREL